MDRRGMTTSRMSSRSVRRLALVATAVLMGVGTIGCGSSDSATDDDKTSSSERADTSSAEPTSTGEDDDEAERDPALDDEDLCNAADHVGETLGLDTGSETMTARDYVRWSPRMVEALDDLLAVDPPADIADAAEELREGFVDFSNALDDAPRGSDPAYPTDEAAIDALIAATPDENRYFELTDLVSGNSLNCD